MDAGGRPENGSLDADPSDRLAAANPLICRLLSAKTDNAYTHAYTHACASTSTSTSNSRRDGGVWRTAVLAHGDMAVPKAAAPQSIDLTKTERRARMRSRDRRRNENALEMTSTGTFGVCAGDKQPVVNDPWIHG